MEATRPPTTMRTKCSMCTQIENGVYAYHCSHCGACYVCKHTLRGFRTWMCPDGGTHPTVWDDGVQVRSPL